MMATMESVAARGRTKCHTVPSTLTPQMRTRILYAVVAGRSVAQTAKEFNTDRCVVAEIWMRDLERRLQSAAGLRRVA